MLLVWVLPNYLIAQSESNINIRGTYIVGTICSDAIIIGADTRAAFLSTTNKLIGYYDEAQKIFKYNNIGIAMKGASSFEESNLTFYGLFKNFKALNPNIKNIPSLYSKLLLYSKTVLKTKEYSALENNFFIIAGYESDTPHVYVCWKGKERHITTEGYRTSDYKDINNQLYDSFVIKLKKAKLNDGIVFTEKLINDKIKIYNKDTVSIVGGNVSIVTIKRNIFSWVKNKFTINSKTVTEDFKLFIQGKLKIIPVIPDGDDILKIHFTNYIKSHN